MTGPIYPATNTAEAVALTISNANQLHLVINGDTETTVETYEGGGNIPSVAKALKDAITYMAPIAWSNGSTETELLQLRQFEGNLYAPKTVPVAMGVTPDAVNWRLYAPLSRVVIQKEKQLGSDITASVSTLTTISYAVGENNLQVFVDGSLAEEGEDYEETTSTTITWLIDVPDDADILFFTGNTTSGEFDAAYLLSIVTEAEAAQAASELARDEAQAAALAATGLVIKSVTTPYTVLAGVADHNTVFVFNDAGACVLNLPEGVTVGVNFSYRNKLGGAITLTPTGASTLEGAGNTTNDSTSVNSAYVESTNLFVSVGDLTEV